MNRLRELVCFTSVLAVAGYAAPARAAVHVLEKQKLTYSGKTPAPAPATRPGGGN